MPFVQANLIDAKVDDMEAVEAWRQHLLQFGVWANKPVPLFPYPGSPDYTRLWGRPDEHAWERAHAHYLANHVDFSDVQDAHPRPLRRSRAARPMHAEHEGRRVLMTADAVGGVWDYALQLAEGLGARGVEVTLATMGPRPRDDQRAAARAIPSLRLVESEYRLEWADEPVGRRGAGGRVAAGSRGAGASPTSCTSMATRMAACRGAHQRWSSPTRACARGGRPCAAASASSEWDEYRRAVRDGLQAAARRRRAILGDAAGAVGALRRDGRHGGAERTRRCAVSRPDPRGRSILSAGRLWDEAKNVTALASIASRLPWRVMLAGERRDADRSAAPDPMLSVPRTPVRRARLRAWMARASIYAMPARYEPFGLSILEAALSGVRLVLGDIPSLREHLGRRGGVRRARRSRSPARGDPAAD